MRTLCAIAAFSLALPLSAAEIPAGTTLTLRLKTKVSSRDSKPKDPVEAVVIAPVVAGGAIVIHQGVLLSGSVTGAKKSAGPEDRATLAFEFTRMYDAGGASVQVQTKLVDVDNARETVDEKGVLTGILASQTISARMDQGLGRLGERMAGFAKLLGGVKGLVIREADPEIVYEPGVEMHVALIKPVRWQGKTEGPRVEGFPNDEELYKLVNAQPFRTVAQSPPKPSDMTNLMFIGTAEDLKSAFAAAGWVEAAALSGVSKFETFRSIAESRGYKEAPMSILLLDGQKPDFDFEKMLNTFAMRHHLRVWRRPATLMGKPVWVSAATHDIGIELSQEQRNFIHKIDSYIDRERAKVVSDLVFTGKVKSLALVDRPGVPREFSNATGDKVFTDGAMAVLMF